MSYLRRKRCTAGDISNAFYVTLFSCRSNGRSSLTGSKGPDNSVTVARISESYSTKVKRVVRFLRSQPSLWEEGARNLRKVNFFAGQMLEWTRWAGRKRSVVTHLRREILMLSVSAFIFGVSLASMESPQKMMNYRVSRARKLDLFRYTRQRIFPRLRHFLSLFIPTFCSDGGKYVINWPRKIKRAELVRLSKILTGRLDPNVRLNW